MININDRLSIFFGQGYGLEIINTSAKGTWVRLKLPRTMADSLGGEQHEQ